MKLHTLLITAITGTVLVASAAVALSSDKDIDGCQLSGDTSNCHLEDCKLIIDACKKSQSGDCGSFCRNGFSCSGCDCDELFKPDQVAIEAALPRAAEPEPTMPVPPQAFSDGLVARSNDYCMHQCMQWQFNKEMECRRKCGGNSKAVIETIATMPIPPQARAVEVAATMPIPPKARAPDPTMPIPPEAAFAMSTSSPTNLNGRIDNTVTESTCRTCMDSYNKCAGSCKSGACRQGCAYANCIYGPQQCRYGGECSEHHCGGSAAFGTIPVMSNPTFKPTATADL